MPEQTKQRLVLLVDDSVEILITTSFLLEASGYRVVCAPNGKKALDILRSPGQELPDVILLDMMMPIMDGSEFRKEQLKDERFAKIPTILITALSPKALSEIGDVQFQSVLNKPIVADELLTRIQELTAA